MVGLEIILRKKFSVQDGMGSHHQDRPDLGKKGSQAGLSTLEWQRHNLKCLDVCLRCFSEMFMLQMVPQLHLSSEKQSIQFFTAQNPVKSVSQTVLSTRICEHNFQKYEETRVRGASLGPFAVIET